MEFHSEDAFNSFIEVIQCPVCYNYANENEAIYCCDNGHYLCEHCRLRMKETEEEENETDEEEEVLVRCPVCRSLETKCRNIGLESTFRQILVHCTNSIYGCAIIDTIYKIIRHRDECHYKSITCVLHNSNHSKGSCNFKASFKVMIRHIVNQKCALIVKAQKISHQLFSQKFHFEINMKRSIQSGDANFTPRFGILCLPKVNETEDINKVVVPYFCLRRVEWKWEFQIKNFNTTISNNLIKRRYRLEIENINPSDKSEPDIMWSYDGFMGIYGEEKKTEEWFKLSDLNMYEIFAHNPDDKNFIFQCKLYV
jgi:hypothetical protein